MLLDKWEHRFFIPCIVSKEWFKRLNDAGWRVSEGKYKNWRSFVDTVESKWFDSHPSNDLLILPESSSKKENTISFAEDGTEDNEFFYTKDKYTFHNASWGTPPTALVPIDYTIKSNLKRILPDDLKQIKLTKAEKIAMKYICSIEKVDLRWFYYDDKGNIFYTHGMKIYRLALNLSFLKNYYQNNVFIIQANNGMSFKYTVENNNFDGYGIGTYPIVSRIYGLLKIITEDIFDKIDFSVKEADDIELCNLDKNGLVGIYFDRHGHTYFNVKDIIYRYAFDLSYCKENYYKL